MRPEDDKPACDESQWLEEFALNALSATERARLQSHVAACTHCAGELESIRATVGAMAGWPGEELRPTGALWKKLAKRIGDEGWTAVEDELALPPEWPIVEWEQPAPGVYCKVLSVDSEFERVSLIVRLDPGADYPPHTHGGVEELHLLDGELWIDDRKLYPGDFNLAQPGTADKRVWSETGCSCVLIASMNDKFA